MRPDALSSEIRKENRKCAYLCHSASKVDPIRLSFAQNPNKHTRIRTRKQHLAHALTMERPELRSAIRRHVMLLRRIQARV